MGPVGVQLGLLKWIQPLKCKKGVASQTRYCERTLLKPTICVDNACSLLHVILQMWSPETKLKSQDYGAASKGLLQHKKNSALLPVLHLQKPRRLHDREHTQRNENSPSPPFG